MKQYIDPNNLSQKQAKHNNNFAVGDIIQGIDNTLGDTQFIYLITDVRPDIIYTYCTYAIMHLTTGEKDTISFDNAHRGYKRIAS